MPKDPQEVTIYEVRSPLKNNYFEQPQSSPDLQHAALIVEVKGHRNRHIAYLLQADLGPIIKFNIVAKDPEHGTAQSLMKKHGFVKIGEYTFVPHKKITRLTLAQIVRQFNELELQYYPFGYSAHPIQHGDETYGINCFGFADHVFIQFGLKTYTKDDVSIMENNPLEPHAQQLRPLWGLFYELLGGKEMPSFKPPDGSLASEASQQDK